MAYVHLVRGALLVNGHALPRSRQTTNVRADGGVQFNETLLLQLHHGQSGEYFGQ